MEQARFENYGHYSSRNYGAHSLKFTDARGNEFYFSYATLVAFRAAGSEIVVRENVWGTTTGKHLNWIDGGGVAKDMRVDEETFKNRYKLLIEE